METKVIMGPREGRHADGDNNFSLSVFPVHAANLNWRVSHVLTTDNGRVDLDIRQ